LTKEEKEKLVEENRWVVNDIIYKYTHLMEKDELEAAGLLGLVEGIERFKKDKGTKVSTYVRHWIRARVLSAVYENRIVHVPWNKINNYIKSHREEPDSPGISGSHKSLTYTPKFEISLDAFSTSGSEDGSSDNIEIQSSLSSEDLYTMEERETQNHVYFALEKSNLSLLEKKAIALRFGLDRKESPMTFAKVAALTGLSVMGAHKAVTRGLNKLKDNTYIRQLIE